MPIKLYDSSGALFLIHGSTEFSEDKNAEKPWHEVRACPDKLFFKGESLRQVISEDQKRMFLLFVSMQANACTYTDHTYKDTHVHTHVHIHTQIWRVLQWAKHWEFKWCSKLWVVIMTLVHYTEQEPEVWVAPQDFRISESRKLYYYKYHWMLDTWRFEKHMGQHNFRGQNTILSLTFFPKFFCSRVTEIAKGVKTLALECWAKSKN